MREKTVIREKDRFNRLVVISEYEKDKYGHKRYLCQCDCKNIVIVLKSQLISGKTGSCGCYQRDRAKETQTKHGQSKTKLYLVWKEMIKRCCDINSKSYTDYGSRGITVCKEWKEDFAFFHNWATTSGYREGLTIERINNDGNYEPNNCKWATRKEQNNNKRNNVLIEHGGEEHTVSEWSEILNIDDKKVRQRIKKLGWDKEQALLTP